MTTDERRRILDMLARGVISIEESEQMLNALPPEARADTGAEAPWPPRPHAAAPAILALLFVGALVMALLAFTFLGARFLFLMIPLIGLLGLPFWIWMLVDCILRPPQRFPGILSPKPETAKLAWLAVILLTNLIGAMIYLAIVFPGVRRFRSRAEEEKLFTNQEEVGEMAKRFRSHAEEEELFTPSPPARSLRRPFWLFILFVAISCTTPLILAGYIQSARWNLHTAITTGSLILWLSLALAMIAFTLWMLLDALQRDRREFGAILKDGWADKLLWISLILFAPLVGGAAYHMAVRRHPRGGEDSDPPAGARAFLKPTFVATGVLLLVIGAWHVLILPHFKGLLEEWDMAIPGLMTLLLDTRLLLYAVIALFLWNLAALVWLRALTDCLTRPEKELPAFAGSGPAGSRPPWLLIILLLPLLGAVLYLFACRNSGQRIQPESPQT